METLWSLLKEGVAWVDDQGPRGAALVLVPLPGGLWSGRRVIPCGKDSWVFLGDNLVCDQTSH